jgi:predicted ATPase
MISKITAENYKCFSRQSFPIAPLTVLTGENAGGKSSLLQILALIQQSWLEQPFDRGLLVNGAELKLGKCEDILNKQVDSDVIAFEIETDVVFLRLEFSAGDGDSSVAPLHSGPRIKTAPDWRERELPEPLPGQGNRFNDAVLQEVPALLVLRDRFYNLQYITADRIGPREIHDVIYSGAYKTVGLRGERAVWFLNKYRKTTVPAGRCHEGQPPVLDKQVEAWMAEIFSGFQFAVTPIPGSDLATLGLATEGNPELIRPQNTGFGLSYTLPIFVACLAAPENGLVLIENPEAHLHPAAQSKFAAFLAEIVSSGVQIILETHSDHIINGVRKAVRAQVINKQNALIYFFRQVESSEQAKVTSIEIDGKGNLTDWPKGFFDQLDDDFEALTDWED